MKGLIKIIAALSSSIIIIGLTSAFSLQDKEPTNEHGVPFIIPEGWPEPSYDFEHNPLSKEGIQLGRELFYDPLLSIDSTISCASCHLSRTAFTHIDHDLSHGIKGRIGRRNSTAIMNVAWQKDFMWNGSINHLEVQPLAPLQDINEMGNNLDGILNYLTNSPKYDTLFQKAFGDSSAVTIDHTLRALAQFMLQFNTSNSKYDQVMRGEVNVTFSESEKHGLTLFRTHCESCHKEPLFTNYEFKNNGLDLDTTLMDLGRFEVTDEPKDSLHFRVPTLRNIEVSYPYMHDGRYRNLSMVIFHYSSNVHKSKILSPELDGNIELVEQEKRDLINFLKTLTDESFLRNKDLAFPRN
jgi:cytochrome c peroxidase